MCMSTPGRCSLGARKRRLIWSATPGATPPVTGTGDGGRGLGGDLGNGGGGGGGGDRSGSGESDGGGSRDGGCCGEGDGGGSDGGSDSNGGAIVGGGGGKEEATKGAEAGDLSQMLDGRTACGLPGDDASRAPSSTGSGMKRSPVKLPSETTHPHPHSSHLAPLCRGRPSSSTLSSSTSGKIR